MGRNRKLVMTSGPSGKGLVDFRPLSSDLHPRNGVRLQGPDSVGASPLDLKLPASLVNNGVYTTDAAGQMSVALLTNLNIDSLAAIDLDKLAALTSSRALVSDGSGVISTSAVTSTELGYLSGATSNIQTQLNAAAPAASAVTLTGVQTLTNKTLTAPVLNQPYIGDYEDLAETTTPSTPSAGRVRVYAKADHRLYKKDSNGIESAVGSGGGSGGVNFLTLDSSWTPLKSDNFDLESSIGDWIAYANAAGTMPVDMTGGSPTISVSRTTTGGEVIDGTASLKVVKGASNVQGQGISCNAYVPLAYRGQVISIQFPFRILSGTLADGDIGAFVYDVTNSQVIVPTNNSVISNGVIRATFPMPSTCAQIRFGLHFSSTSSVAVTYVIDDIQVGPQEIVYGPSMSEWQRYTPTFTGFGTVANVKFNWRQVGGSIEIQGYFETGTVSGVEARVSLPNGYVIKSGEVLSIRGQAGTSTGTDNDFSVIGEGGQSYVKFAQYNISATGPVYEAVDGTNFPNGAPTALFVSLPIQGLATNSIQQNAGMFSLAGLLANGTRVTGSPPTRLGEYRSYLINAGAYSTTETNGDPSPAISVVDGIPLWAKASFAGGPTANQPNAYDIFIGRNKKVIVEGYSSTGRSGYISLDCYVYGSPTVHAVGTQWAYDPNTGILSVQQFQLGDFYDGLGQFVDPATGSFIRPSQIYFDAYVSDQFVPVQVTPNRSEVMVYGGNGHGSTNDCVRCFTDIETNEGTAVSYTADTVNGDSFTINEDGVYSISYTDYHGTSTAYYFGISINSTQLTTSVGTINIANLVQMTTALSAQPCSVSSTTTLRKGDVIRAHVESAVGPNGTTDNFVTFRITKVSN